MAEAKKEEVKIYGQWPNGYVGEYNEIIGNRLVKRWSVVKVTRELFLATKGIGAQAQTKTGNKSASTKDKTPVDPQE